MTSLWRRSWRTAVLLAALAAVAEPLLAGCMGGPAVASRKVTIPTFTTTTQKPVIRPPATALPQQCEDMLTMDDLQRLMDRPMPGIVHTLVDIPNPQQGRTGRVDCRYAVSPDDPFSGTAPIEIGAADYVDAPTASARVAFTVDYERGRGATAADVPIGKDHATLLTGPEGPELVLAKGKATVTIVATNGLLPPDKLGPALGALAGQCLPAIPQ